MLKLTMHILALSAAAVAIGGWLDRRGHLTPLWLALSPPVMLPPAPDARVAAAEKLGARLAQVKSETAQGQLRTRENRHRLEHLRMQLAQRFASHPPPGDQATQIMEGDPIAAALILSIAAEQHRGEALDQQSLALAQLQAQLEARLIALSNGVAVEQLQLDSPLQQLRLTASEADDQQRRYGAIVRAALAP